MDHAYAEPLLPPDDLGIEHAAKRAIATLRDRYGADLFGVFLFGSRARGNYQPDSDVNIAVVIEDRCLAETSWDAFNDLQYDMLIETGTELHFAIIGRSEWLGKSPTAPASRVRAIRREAIDLLTPFWLD